ncbi:MAG: hypothetical protein EOP86_20480, partial [Verrucomicrobiaceae bacterium]
MLNQDGAAWEPRARAHVSSVNGLPDPRTRNRRGTSRFYMNGAPPLYRRSEKGERAPRDDQFLLLAHPTRRPRSMNFRLLAFTACACAAADGRVRAGDPVAQFEREVRPLLEGRCFECHGPEKQKGGLRLDQKASILGAGDSEHAAVVPGDSAASQVIKRVLSTDPDDMMPPEGQRLTAEETASIKKWIDAGAHWPRSGEPEAAAVPREERAITGRDREFWAFQKPQRKSAAGPPDA